VIFDPAVFRSEALGRAIFNDYRLFGYAEIAIGVVALAYYLLARRASAFLAGTLYAGAVFSGLLGLFMLPLTLLGLVILIGIFGFAPFLSAFVMERNASRCWRESTAGASRARALGSAMLVAILVLAVPLLSQVAISRVTTRAMAVLQSGSEQDFTGAVRTLKLLKFGAATDDIVYSYQRTGDPQQRERLARAYQAITAQDILDRIAELD
jgi:hypothetical protein